VRGGHKLNHGRAHGPFLADRSAWRVIEAENRPVARAFYAEAGSGMVGGMIAPAYGPRRPS